MADTYGVATEKRLRSISGFWGVPDFVFRPTDYQKGGGQREIGDFVLWVGDAVAIVSVKSRDPVAASEDSDSRRHSWLDKNIAKARDQIDGVARKLRNAAPGEFSLVSERGVDVPWDPGRVGLYIGVVIVQIDRPGVDYAPGLISNSIPTIVMLAADWSFLHQVLPSTTSVIRYASNRSRQIPSCPLGAEPDVLALIVESENTGSSITVPASGLPKDYYETVVASHPEWFFGTQDDDRFAFIIDAMIEGVADADPEFSDTTSATDYLTITEFLDRIPLLPRVSIGKSIISQCEAAGESGGRVVKRYGVPHGLLVVASDNAARQDRALDMRALTVARHSQALDAGAPPSLVTLGVVTDPIPTEQRSHDFILIQGGIRSDPVYRAKRDDLFGAPDFEPLVAYWSKPRRADA